MRAIVMLVAAAACAALACGGGATPKGDPVPVDVPVGLTVHCASALDGGTISSDGTRVDASLADGQCLLYRFDTVAAARYSVQVAIEPGGNVDVIVASTAEFTDLVAASNAFGDGPESTSFVSPSGQTYHVAIIGRADQSAFSTRVVLNVASPAGERDCVSTVAGGELRADGTSVDDIVFPRSCVLYTFEGTVDSVYRLVLALDAGDPVRSVAVARDRDVTDRIQSSSFLAAPTTLYFTTAATQTFYVLVVGEFLEAGRYQIALERGTAPIGLADLCFQATSRGAAPSGWSEITAALPVRECHLYSLAVAAGDVQFVGLRRLGPGFDAPLRVATDPAFRSLVTTSSATIEGSAAQAFVAGATQTLYLAVLTLADTTFDYGLRTLSSPPPPSALESFCNRSTPGGSLTVDGGAVSGSAMAAQCVTYSLAVEAGVTYSVVAEPGPGTIALFAAQDFDHVQSLGSSSTTLGPQGLSFTAPATGTVQVTVAGRVDGTRFQVAAVTTLAVPAPLAGRCSFAVDAGALAVGAAATAGFAASDHCTIYRFAGVAGTSYTVTLSGVDLTNPDMTLASDASFAGILGEPTTTGDDAIVFDAPASQTFYLAVHGFQAVEYTISVQVSPAPPPGLAALCDSAKDGGVLTVGAPASTRDAAVPGQCVLYAFSGTTGTRYTVTVFTTRGDPSLRVASDAAFNDVLTTQAKPGGETFSFTAAASQEFHLAVFPATATETDFEIFVTSP